MHEQGLLIKKKRLLLMCMMQPYRNRYSPQTHRFDLACLHCFFFFEGTRRGTPLLKIILKGARSIENSKGEGG
jgi:hypothetical protein